MHQKSLFIFRQDLRAHDNTGLIEAMKNSKEVFPIFIYDTRSTHEFGPDDPRFGLIREALETIDTELQKVGGRLTVYTGKPQEVVEELIQKYQINALYCNRSYSPRGKERDETIEGICDTYSIDFHSFQDFLLVEPHECEQRKVFTPYSMLWKKFLIAHPERLQIHSFDGAQTTWFVPDDRHEIGEVIRLPHHPLWTMEFGRSRLDRDFSHYDELRNLPAVDGSTRLSPYIRFGIFSIREIYRKFVPKPPLQRGAGGILIPGKNPQSTTERVDSSFTKELTETLLNELIWREFWYQIAYYFPFTYDIEFQERRRIIEWKTDTSSYEWQRFTE